MAVKIITTPLYEQFVKTNRTVVIDFYAQWCGPCKMLEPIMEDLSDHFANKNVQFGKVDIDLNQSLAAELGIKSIQTVIIYRHGKILTHFVGFKNKQEVQQLIDQAIQPDQI